MGNVSVVAQRHPEAVAVPFSFGRERRRGILDSVLGVRDRGAQYAASTPEDVSPSSSSDVPRGVERRLRRLSQSQEAQRRHSEAAIASLQTSTPPKQLARAFDSLGNAIQRTEQRLATSRARHAREILAAATKERNASFQCSPRSESGDIAMVSPTLPLSEQQRSELSALLAGASLEDAAESTPARRGLVRRRRRSTFGSSQRPDLLVSLRRAGHVSCTATESEIAPGMYELPAAQTPPSHNLRFKMQATAQRNARASTLQQQQQQSMDSEQRNSSSDSVDDAPNGDQQR
ncbi:hypothetical protein PINS_up005025 [Pythium insidiosum]|nr:hypothetical protein PINS_up005025 [Pythium insidiosum]